MCHEEEDKTCPVFGVVAGGIGMFHQYNPFMDFYPPIMTTSNIYLIPIKEYFITAIHRFFYSSVIEHHPISISGFLCRHHSPPATE
jgi:hypothetical protein